MDDTKEEDPKRRKKHWKRLKLSIPRARVNIVLSQKQTQRKWIFSILSQWIETETARLEIRASVGNDFIHEVISYLHSDCFVKKHDEDKSLPKPASSSVADFWFTMKAATMKSNTELGIRRDAFEDHVKSYKKEKKQAIFEKVRALHFPGIEEKKFGRPSSTKKKKEEEQQRKKKEQEEAARAREANMHARQMEKKRKRLAKEREREENLKKTKCEKVVQQEKAKKIAKAKKSASVSISIQQASEELMKKLEVHHFSEVYAVDSEEEEVEEVDESAVYAAWANYKRV